MSLRAPETDVLTVSSVFRTTNPSLRKLYLSLVGGKFSFSRWTDYIMCDPPDPSSRTQPHSKLGVHYAGTASSRAKLYHALGGDKGSLCSKVHCFETSVVSSARSGFRPVEMLNSAIVSVSFSSRLAPETLFLHRNYPDFRYIVMM